MNTDAESDVHSNGVMLVKMPMHTHDQAGGSTYRVWYKSELTLIDYSLNASVTAILGHQTQSAEQQHNLKAQIENKTRQPTINLAELNRNNMNHTQISGKCTAEKLLLIY